MEPDLLRNILHQILLLANASLSYLAFFRFKDDEKLYSDYRKRIIPVLLNSIEPSYKYRPSAKIYAKEFLLSGLYHSKLNKLTRQDRILGIYKKAAFSMSFVKAQSREFIGRSGITGTRNTTYITHFQGLHYVFKVPVNFTGKTVVLPIANTDNMDVNEKNEYNLRRLVKNEKKKKIILRNQQFDDSFAVFTNYEKEARNFLSEKRIKSILHINALFKYSVALSFFGNVVFLHAHTDREVFTLNLSKPIDEQQVLNNYINLKIGLDAMKILLD